MYLMWYADTGSAEKALAAADKEIERLQAESLGLQKQRLVPTGAAFVTFSYERHAKAALRDLGRPWLTRMALTCKTGSGSPPKFRGQRITVRTSSH